jgi:hypothetical protein
MMDDIFLPQTGDPKMDEAYAKVLAFVDRHEEFSQFFDAFVREVKTDDKVYLNRWLLKVVWAHLKHKHPFDRVYDAADESWKVKLRDWFDKNLKSIGEEHR